MSRLQRERKGEPSSLELITDGMSAEFPDRGWTGGFTTQILEVAVRDGVVFIPRPGYYQIVVM